MILTQEQVAALMRMLRLTREEEATCDDCLERLAEFATEAVADRPVPAGLRAIDDHLRMCGECREEFEALRTALRSDPDGEA